MTRDETKHGTGKWLALAIVLAGGALAWMLIGPMPLQTEPGLAPAPQLPALPAAEVPATGGNVAEGVIEPAIRFPMPEVAPQSAAPAAPLPELDNSDAAFGEGLAALFGGRVSELMVTDRLVRRIVVTVDNLPGERLPWSWAPLRAVGGAFLVEEAEGGFVVAGANSARYQAYVRLVEAVPAQAAVALYSRFYPLFQRAYEELGYPSAYFNDRLVAVIDHLIAAPELAGPIRLVQPKVRYRFADERLEALSAGQKVMLRMGADNAARVKAKLREIRALLVAGAQRR